MMNRIRVIVLLVCILLISSSISACSRPVKDQKIDELRENHGVMFVAQCSNWGPIKRQSDYWIVTVFRVYYDGTIEGYSDYNFSGKTYEFSAEISDTDYKLLYSFLSNGFIKGKYDDVDANDGEGWDLVYYDTEGEVLHKYCGYIYGVYAYKEITDMLYSYRPLFDEPQIYPGGESTATAPTGTSDETTPKTTAAGSLTGELEITLNYKHIDDIASNQFAVWIEDSSGKVVRTLYVTSFTADGGWEFREDSLTVWVERAGMGSDDAPDIDAFSGATPKPGPQSYIWDCTDEEGQPVPAGEYHFFVDATIFWEDAALFEGTIELGGEEATAAAEPTFTNDEAKVSDMITDVSAVYRP